MKIVSGAIMDEAKPVIPNGSGVDAVGGRLAREQADRLIEGCREYLLLIADEVLGRELRSKVDASDLVQDTFLEAQRHVATFRGRTETEVRAWLRRILECRLSNLRRSYLGTEKRATRREVSTDALQSVSEHSRTALASASASPSDQVVRQEWTRVLEAAMERLPHDHRQVVAWRHEEQLSWDQIGLRMGRTADAARKVCFRAIQQLRRELASNGSMP